MADKALETIQNALGQLESCIMMGVFKGPVMLSPTSVKATKPPRFWQTRVKFKFDSNKNARSLHSNTWKSRGEQKIIHVYDGGIRFPDLCPVTLEPPSRYEIVESFIPRIGMGRIQIEGKRERVERIGKAAGCDRYWYALPFSQGHGIKDRAVHFTSGEGVQTHNNKSIFIRNREYAIRFAKSTGLKGLWLGTKHVVMRTMGITFFILFLGMAGAFGLVLADKSTTGGIADSAPLLLSIGLAGSIGAIILWIMGNKGEPLVKDDTTK